MTTSRFRVHPLVDELSYSEVREAVADAGRYLSIDTSLMSMLLLIGAEQKARHVKTLTNVAAALRAGESVALFADGEPGAAAAEYLASSHQYDLDRINAIRGVIWECEHVLLFVGPEDGAA